MLVTPFILAIVFISLIIVSPFIFKAIFKNRICWSYAIGLFASIIFILIFSGLIYGVIKIISFSKNKNNINNIPSDTQKNLNTIYGITYGYLFLVFFILTIPHTILLFILLCFIKMAERKEKGFSFIFMFISGFNLIFIFPFIAGITESLRYNSVNNEFRNTVPLISLSERVMNIGQIQIFGLMILYDSCSIMFMLHYKKVNGYILWIGIASLYMPYILLLLVFININLYYFLYFIPLIPIISLVLAIIFYVKYSDQDNLEKKGFLEPSSIGVEEDD